MIGLGEIGTALQRVLQCDGIDKKDDAPQSSYDVLHIAFPYSDTFVSDVATYQWRFSPVLVVIHSTVAIGTSRRCGAVYSPVRGKHPHLEKSLRTFVKYFGGADASEAAALFKHVCPVSVIDDQESVEAMKLWDTEQYYRNIEIEKEIYAFCEERGLDFNVVYTHANKTYNTGYAALGMPHFTKYVLEHMPGEVGGHCLQPNRALLHKAYGNDR